LIFSKHFLKVTILFMKFGLGKLASRELVRSAPPVAQADLSG
jgi:hypothetical protein